MDILIAATLSLRWLRLSLAIRSQDIYGCIRQRLLERNHGGTVRVPAGFENDCKAWGNWMAERERHSNVLKAMRELGAEALLACKTDGMWWFQIRWTTPQELAEASRRLREAVTAGNPKTKRILETYAAYDGVEDAEEEFAQDLRDLERLASFAESQGVQKMTLEVNW